MTSLNATEPGYLRSGAWIRGEPAWDADYNCADQFLLLPVSAMNQRCGDEVRGT